MVKGKEKRKRLHYKSLYLREKHVRELYDTFSPPETKVKVKEIVKHYDDLACDIEYAWMYGAALCSGLRGRLRGVNDRVFLVDNKEIPGVIG